MAFLEPRSLCSPRSLRRRSRGDSRATLTIPLYVHSETSSPRRQSCVYEVSIRPFASLCSIRRRCIRNAYSGVYQGIALMEQRGHQRIGVEYSAAFSGSAYRVNGTVLNLSMVGCRCRTGVVVQIGEALRLLIHVPRYEHPLYVALAEVRWSQGEEFGVEFIHMELEDRHRLAEVIRS